MLERLFSVIVIEVEPTGWLSWRDWRLGAGWQWCRGRRLGGLAARLESSIRYMEIGQEWRESQVQHGREVCIGKRAANFVLDALGSRSPQAFTRRMCFQTTFETFCI